MWQYSILEKLGHNVCINSFSGQSHYIPSNYNQTKIIQSNININSITGNELTPREINTISSKFDTIICSFPPKFIDVFNKIKCKYPKILNCGHRLHIHCKNDISFIEKLKTQVLNKEVILCSMSKYDTEYIKHYLNLEPIELYVTCCYLPDIKYSPNRKEILIAPVNADNVAPFECVDKMNKISRTNGLNLIFSKIKDIYPNYSFSDLLNHRACVLFPYSAFSISMIEMYELNIPMFVPSKKLILRTNLMHDVSLFPCYCYMEEMQNYDKPHIDSPHKFSPNSYNHVDRDYWLSYSYFYNKKHIIVWDTIPDLFYKLMNTNFQEISDKMKIENEEFRNEQMNNWKNLLKIL
jgi:hypothetical protein